ncbi:MAG: L-threonylcarbamoyladenylate synthase [Ruminococcus sp.]|jgi:tRNA A37 threonylcarbamoyladenosine synthetase subunit TsaC/SUA5/YrdC|nr:L-threonylcarbamoyladenylate synthase [Ruminococcus sp.]
MLISLPTETVYGIFCPFDNKDEIEEIYRIKGRDFSKPMAIHTVPEFLPEDVKKMFERFGYNALTIIYNDVGYRIPQNDVFCDYVKKLGKSLIGTSANPSGEKPAVTAGEVRDYFPDLKVVDGGKCSVGVASTVIKVLRF